MSRSENVELTSMCMISDTQGNVLVQDKKDHPTWRGWNFPGGHVENGESVTASVIREVFEETGLVIKAPLLCGIKEFHKASDGNRYIVFLYRANSFTGKLTPSKEGDLFWYPLNDLLNNEFAKNSSAQSFTDMLKVFTDDSISEVFYQRHNDKIETLFY